MHRDALLSPEDRAVLQAWAGTVERLEREDQEHDKDEKHKDRD